MTATHRLLVVDDNEDNRDMLARRLRRRGYDVDTAEDGFIALDRAEADHYDLVILDIMMPGMSGLEVLRRLREIYPRAELPVLMATAKSGSEDMVKALELGANDYVTKPIDFPVVLARIQGHLQTRLQAPSIAAPAAPIPEDGHVEPGTVLDGRYRIEELIGEGGFAIVFRAIQLSTGQTVALKILRNRRLSSSRGKIEASRFEREMRLIGKLKHPSVVRLIDFGTLRARVQQQHTGWTETTDASGEIEAEESTGSRTILRQLPYIVMEYVQGEPLHTLLKREAPLDVTTAVELLLPVLSAVAVAHEAGVLHRDLKPPNIMVETQSGRRSTKVLDFGIAKRLDDDNSSVVTQSEGLLGTPEYMAPELIRESKEAKPAADQYAMGCILYECVVGSRPFRASTFVELVQRVTLGDFDRPSQLQVAMPEGFEAVLLRSMDKDPKRRFSSASTFGRALLPFASPGVRARWAPFFDVASDPPPSPEAIQTERVSEHAIAAEPPVESSSPTLEAQQAPAAARVGLLLIGAGLLMALAAVAALLLR